MTDPIAQHTGGSYCDLAQEMRNQRRSCRIDDVVAMFLGFDACLCANE